MKKTRGGYTLVELIIAIGLFALVMTLSTGAYLIMIGVSRQTQAMSIGIDNLSFALETMTRTIRTGTNYRCNTGKANCNGGLTFSVLSPGGVDTTYALTFPGGAYTGGAITQNGIALTDPSVNVSSLLFYASGMSSLGSNGDVGQPRVIMLISGTVSSGPGKTIPFTVETMATMRGTDL